MMYTFQLTEQQTQVIIKALEELPLRISLDTFMTIQQQAAQQQQEAPDVNPPTSNSPGGNKKNTPG